MLIFLLKADEKFFVAFCNHVSVATACNIEPFSGIISVKLYKFASPRSALSK